MKQTTSCFRRDSYEAQLSAEEVKQLHDAIRSPQKSLEQLSKEAPPWRLGPEMGKTPCKKTLLRIARRLRAEDSLNKMAETKNWLRVAKKSLRVGPRSHQPDEILDVMCSLIGLEVIQKQLLQQQTSDLGLKMKLLMRREDQALAIARFRRDTCKKFVEWYQDDRVRAILDSQDSNAEKIQQLGKLMYGDAWE